MDAPLPRLSQVVARDVTKLFGATPALRGAHLEMRPGEIVLLTGPNGAGKSTLLSIVGTHLRPTRGTVDYLDDHGKRLTPDLVRAQLGWVSHTSHCYRELSGKKNVELAAELQGVPPSRYDDLAVRLGLGAFANRPMRTLSRGQTQRIALGRALIHAPTLLLLDEPWTGLDRKSAALLEDIVREESKRGALIAIVSHEPDLKERLGAREVRLIRGQTQTISAA